MNMTKIQYIKRSGCENKTNIKISIIWIDSLFIKY